MSSGDKLLLVSVVADRLKVTPRQIHYMIADGRLPAVRASARVIRIYESALNKFLEENQMEVGA